MNAGSSVCDDTSNLSGTRCSGVRDLKHLAELMTSTGRVAFELCWGRRHGFKGRAGFVLFSIETHRFFNTVRLRPASH